VSNAEILNALKASLNQWLTEEPHAPDVVVVSGDITQKADKKEYEEAERFLCDLLGHLNLDVNRLIVVPGNHDVYWPASDAAMRASRTAPSTCTQDLIIKIGDDLFLCPESEEEYQRRFDNFRNFYKSLYGTDYPGAREKQFTIHSFDDLGVAFAGFNSCDLIDSRRFRPSIHAAAICGASDQLSTFPGLCIAVWHHDMDWRNEGLQDTLKYDCLQHISQRVFRFSLCGHTHRPAGHDMQTIGHNPLPVIAAGSLCAGRRERGDSVPRAFNLIEISDEVARVHTRIKEERSSPWCPYARFRFQDTWVPWFNVQLPGKGRKRSVDPNRTATTRRETNIKRPTPFRESIASKTHREEAVLQYVWNYYAEAFDCAVPQIVLGPRGSGKTALLLSLTFEGRRDTVRYRNDPAGVLARIGLMCPMKIVDVSSFANKGWLDKGRRREMFTALISTLWAKELVDTLEACVPWSQGYRFTAPFEGDCSRTLGSIWFNITTCNGYDGVREHLREVRFVIRKALSEADDVERAKTVAQVRGYPIYHGGLELLAAAADFLKRWEAFNNTSWFVLFDEVEYLNDWQQEVVYRYLAVSAEGINIKIATLPYSHVRALEHLTPRIVEHDDYQELALALPAQVTARDPTEDSAATTFVEIAKGIWRGRLAAANINPVELENVWPEEEYAHVLAAAGVSNIANSDQLEVELIRDLPEESKHRAARLREHNRSAFSDQYWRKYQQPFRLRLAKRLEIDGMKVPLYWGCSTLLKACDGNCRWFLMLADECWRMFWSLGGVRPLSAEEQHRAVMSWAASIARKCGSFGEHGNSLKEIVDQIIGMLTANLYGRQCLTREIAKVKAHNITTDQANAIAIGIAYGFLVPDLESPGASTGSYTYPKADIEMRLGYPIVVSKALLLRKGVAARIPDLRQAVFPWWNEQ
jgi:predicted phosphodiesterase